MTRLQKMTETIMTLLNLPPTYDPKNGIPASTYSAIAQELMDFSAQDRGEALEEAAKVADICASECAEHERNAIKQIDFQLIAELTKMGATAKAIAKQIRALKTPSEGER